MSEVKGAPVSITDISENAANQLSSKQLALAGTVTLTSSSNYGAGTGIAPTGTYSGFIVGGNGVTITSLKFNNTTHSFAPGEDINSLVFVSGLFYPYNGLTDITISAGSILLIRKNN